MKIRSGGKRSASPVVALTRVPTMKPIWVAATIHPNCAAVASSQSARPAAAPLGLNHSDVPKHWAMTMMRADEPRRPSVSVNASPPR